MVERKQAVSAPVERKQPITMHLMKYYHNSSLTSDDAKDFFLLLGEDENLFGDVEDDRLLSRDKILEKIREKKEVIEKLRCQPWSMRRKLRTLRLAHKYLERHEAKVSRSHLIREELNNKWRKFKRQMKNFSVYLIPWEARIRRIESHYGSVVSSYFTFLRWIFWVNFVISLFMASFIVIPEVLGDAAVDVTSSEELRSRKQLNANLKKQATYIQTIWDFNGYIRVSPIFYGFYATRPYIGKFNYQLPLAYFLVYFSVLAYSFWAILRKMASNARMSKLTSGKAEQYTFGWKVFTGWDYTIGNPETATNTVAANANRLRETINEHEAAMQRKVGVLRFFARIFANIFIVAFLTLSMLAVYSVVERSKETSRNANAFRQNEVPIVISFITLFFPNVFEVIGKMEKYHPRTQLRIHLIRILALYLINFYTLGFALITKMNDVVATHGQKEKYLSELWKIANNTVMTSAAMSTTNSYRLVRSITDYITTQAPHLMSKMNNETLRNATLLYLAMTGSTPAMSPTTTASPTSRFTRDIDYSTKIPGYGRVGVDNANATLQENIPWLRQHFIRDMQVTPLNRPDENWDAYNSERGPSPKQIYQSIHDLDDETKMRLFQYHKKQRICWETRMGQEIARLITMDLVMTLAAVLMIDFVRGVWVRYCNVWWCWNLETKFPGYGEFKVAENVLHIINNQGMIWLGMFFAPMLPTLNIVKLIIIMYVRSWAVMSCNVPASQVFRASRSNNFYFFLLLLVLFLITLPVGWVIASQKPSRTCGPFANRDRFYHVVTDRVKEVLPKKVYNVLEHFVSPGVVVPVLVLMVLIIYFLLSLCRALKASNADLKKQLQQEGTEEKRKVYAMAAGGRVGERTNAFGPTMPETKKTDLLHMPRKEQMRRDGWRPRLALAPQPAQGLGRVTEDESSDSSIGEMCPPGGEDFSPVVPSTTIDQLPVDDRRISEDKTPSVPVSARWREQYNEQHTPPYVLREPRTEDTLVSYVQDQEVVETPRDVRDLISSFQPEQRVYRTPSPQFPSNIPGMPKTSARSTIASGPYDNVASPSTERSSVVDMEMDTLAVLNEGFVADEQPRPSPRRHQNIPIQYSPIDNMQAWPSPPPMPRRSLKPTPRKRARSLDQQQDRPQPRPRRRTKGVQTPTGSPSVHRVPRFRIASSRDSSPSSGTKSTEPYIMYQVVVRPRRTSAEERLPLVATESDLSSPEQQRHSGRQSRSRRKPGERKETQL